MLTDFRAGSGSEAQAQDAPMRLQARRWLPRWRSGRSIWWRLLPPDERLVSQRHAKCRAAGLRLSRRLAPGVSTGRINADTRVLRFCRTGGLRSPLRAINQSGRAAICRLLLRAVVSASRSLDAKDVEILILRHQLEVLQRKKGRPRFRQDRMMLAALARVLPRDRCRCLLVRPETVLRWHRQQATGRARRWGRKSLGRLRRRRTSERLLTTPSGNGSRPTETIFGSLSRFRRRPMCHGVAAGCARSVHRRSNTLTHVNPSEEPLSERAPRRQGVSVSRHPRKGPSRGRAQLPGLDRAG
jgi:hypothetical protein